MELISKQRVSIRELNYLNQELEKYKFNKKRYHQTLDGLFLTDKPQPTYQWDYEDKNRPK